MEPKVIYINDTERAHNEAISKGYRRDLIVQIGNRQYKLFAITIERLQQDVAQEVCDSEFYLPEPNTIIVKDASCEELESMIHELWLCKYFEKLDAFGFEIGRDTIPPLSH